MLKEKRSKREIPCGHLFIFSKNNLFYKFKKGFSYGYRNHR